MDKIIQKDHLLNLIQDAVAFFSGSDSQRIHNRKHKDLSVTGFSGLVGFDVGCLNQPI